jgi:hypothetical protein
MSTLFVNEERYEAQELSICGLTTLIKLTRDDNSMVHIVPTDWWISDQTDLVHRKIHYRKPGNKDENRNN